MVALGAFVAVLVVVFVICWLWTSPPPTRKPTNQSRRRSQSARNDDDVDGWSMEFPRRASRTNANSGYTPAYVVPQDRRGAPYVAANDAGPHEGAPEPCADAPVDDGMGASPTCSSDDAASASDSGGGWFGADDD